MTFEQFNQILEYMQRDTVGTLKRKSAEYASDTDRLHNFRVAAAYQGVTEEQAWLGMAAKHFVSISDMIRENEIYPLGLWKEKISDSINYLFLLWAMECEKAHPEPPKGGEDL